MAPSWLRQLFKKRFTGHAKTAPIWNHLGVEMLEDRVVPDTKVWTGGAIAAAGGLGTNSVNARWSSSLNWANGVPNTGDSVLFPTGLSSSAKPPAQFVNGVFTWPANSVIDQNFDINSIEVDDDNYHIDGPQGGVGSSTLIIRGSIVSKVNVPLGSLTGLSLIGPLFGTSSLAITLGGTTQLNGASGIGVLEISAPIGELTAGLGLNKIGPATMALSGNNSFTGTVNVNEGILVAGNNTALGTTALGTTVQPGATLGFSGGTIGDALTLYGDGVTVFGQPIGALAQMSRPLGTFSGGQLSGPGNPTWSGNITLATNVSIGATGSMVISGQITGGFNLSKVGGGTVALSNTNLYNGQTLVKAGVLEVRNDGALSAGSSTTVFDGAALALSGNRTIDEVLFLNGTGGGSGALRLITNGATASWIGAITLQSSTFIGAIINSTLIINPNGLTNGFTGGPTADLTKVGEGTLRFPTANTGFGGNTIITNGRVVMSDAQALGPATSAGGPNPGGSISVMSSGLNSATLRVEGSYTVQKSLTLAGPGYSNDGALHIVDTGTAPNTVGSAVVWNAGITLSSATVIVTDPKSSLNALGVIGAPVAGTSASLSKQGTGTLTLSAANTYLGATILEAGLTVVNSDSSLGGAGGNGTTVVNNATLRLANALSISEDLVLTGKGVSVGGVFQGVLQTTTGSSTITGTVTLSGIGSSEADINVAGGTLLTLPGSIGGDADLHKIGTGELRLTGTTNNTFLSSTFVDAGTLALGKTAGVTALRGPVFVGDGLGGDSVDILRLDSSDQIPELRNNGIGGVSLVITVGTSGKFDLNGFNETVGGLSLQGGVVQTGLGTLTLGGNGSVPDVTTVASSEQSIITGNLSLGAAARDFTVANGAAAIDLLVDALITGSGGIVKNGTGVMQVTNTSNNYTGVTQVANGTLEVAAAVGPDNALPAATDLVIDASGTVNLLNSSDTVASLSGNGTLTLGTVRLTVGGDNTSTTFSGVIGGSGAGGITKIGTGVLTLSGNSPGYTGGTTVSAGTLSVTGNLSGSAITVGSAGTLGGTGTVGAVTVNAGGTVAPGTSPGTLTALTVTFNGGTFAVDLAKPAAVPISDTLAILTNLNTGTGNPTLVLNTAAYANPNLTDVFTIVTTGTSGVPSTFRFNRPDGTTIQNGETIAAGGRVFTVTYNTNSITLSFAGFQATGTLVSNINPSSPGQTVKLTATISPANPGDPTPTGTVTFTDTTTSTVIAAGVPLDPSGSASVNYAFTTLGTHTVTASYTSSNNYQPLTATLTQTVNLPTATTVTSSVSRSVFGDTVVFTAQVTSSGGTPTGSVTFVNATTGATLGTVGLDGSGFAQLFTNTVSSGTNTIQAIYSGSGTFRTSSGTTTLKVVPQPLLAVGGAQGGGGVVSVYDPRTGSLRGQGAPFGPYAGGVKVGSGDVNGDGFSDLVLMGGPGIENGHVVILSGRDFSLLANYNIGYAGELNLAVGDVNGDGKADVILSTATDFDYVAVFSGATQNLLGVFSVFGGLHTGVTLAAGDFNGDGVDEIYAGTATQYAGAVVYDFRTNQRLGVFIIPVSANGVNVAAGDVDGDGKADVILGTANDFPIVAVFDAASQQLKGGFSAFPGQPFGVRVAAVDRNGDGKDEIVTTFNGPIALGVYYDGLTFSVVDGFLQVTPGIAVSPHGLNVGAAD